MEEKTKKPKKTTEKKIKTDSSEAHADKNLICIIRIAGEVKVRDKIVNTLYRLRLRQKYSCTLINPNNKGLMGMLKKVQHYVAYGEIDENTLKELIKARGKSKEGDNKKVKISAEEAAKELMNGKSLEELGLKSFFRLHPPRKGIKSKLIYPKGALGNHKDKINELVRRML